MENENEKLSCLLWGICFLIPLVGIILYFTDKTPKGKAAGKAALIGIGFGFLIGFIATLSGTSSY